MNIDRLNMNNNNEQLQAFFLYCQAVETAYHEWKQYWINFYMNQDNEKSIGLYDPFDPNVLNKWLKKQTTFGKNSSTY